MCIFNQDYVETTEWIDCPAPLPEAPADALLTEVLVPAPYKAPEKKATRKAKRVRSGARRKGASDATSEDKTRSSTAEDDVYEEEEESDSPPDGGRKKRAASTNLEAGMPKRGKGSLADKTAWDIDGSPERPLRSKPLTAS